MASLLETTNAITVYRGESKTVRFTVLDGAGAVIPLTGLRVVFSMKRDIRDVQPLIQKTSDSPGEILFTAPDVGELEVYLLPSDTMQDARTYVFDMWLELSPTERYILVPPSDFVVVRAVTTFA